MILDAQLEVSSAQSLSGATTTVSTNYVNLGGAIRVGEQRVAVHVSAKSGTTPDLKIEVFGDSQTSFASEKSIAARTIATADLVAGKVYHVDLPPAAPYQYYRVKYTQSGNADNAATVSAWFTDEGLEQTQIQLAGVAVP